MNATTSQLILAAIVIGVIAMLTYAALYYANRKGAADATEINSAKLAEANEEVSVNLSVGDAADSLSNAAF